MLNRQTNVIALNVVNDTNTVEAKLLQMKALKDQMKALEAEFNMIKKDVITEYFVNNDTYMNSKGLVLATYKNHAEKRFNTDKFKADFADIYENYREESTVSKFLIK